MSSDLKIHLGQHVSQNQSDAQSPMLENLYPTSQSLFLSPNHMQFPYTGPYGDSLPVPSNIQLQHHPNPPTIFSLPTSFQHKPLYQQSSQACLFNPSQQNSQPHHPTQTTPQPLVTSIGGGKNWTSEEDLQLCQAWVKESKDPANGVGQKMGTFWSRVTSTFHKLMQEVCRKESSRNQSSCQNRMSDLKTLCNKWFEIQTKAFQQPASSLSLCDSEAIARKMWEEEHKGKPFKHMACWQVLKDCPRWNGINNSVSLKSTSSRSQSHVGLPHEPVGTPFPKSALVPIASNMDRSQSYITPGMEEEDTSCTDDLTGMGDTYTLNLIGPASVDIAFPPGQNVAETNQGQKKQKLSDAQVVASQNFRAEIVSLHASANASHEKSREDKHAKDVRNGQVLQEERRMQAHLLDLELTKNRYDIMDKLTAASEKLIVAVQKLDEFGHVSMLTPNQKFQYDLIQQTVAIHKRQIAELKESLERTQFKSPLCMEPLVNIFTVGTSQRPLDSGEDEVILEDD